MGRTIRCPRCKQLTKVPTRPTRKSDDRNRLRGDDDHDQDARKKSDAVLLRVGIGAGTLGLIALATLAAVVMMRKPRELAVTAAMTKPAVDVQVKAQESTVTRTATLDKRSSKLPVEAKPIESVPSKPAVAPQVTPQTPVTTPTATPVMATPVMEPLAQAAVQTPPLAARAAKSRQQNPMLECRILRDRSAEASDLPLYEIEIKNVSDRKIEIAGSSDPLLDLLVIEATTSSGTVEKIKPADVLSTLLSPSAKTQVLEPGLAWTRSLTLLAGSSFVSGQPMQPGTYQMQAVFEYAGVRTVSDKVAIELKALPAALAQALSAEATGKGKRRWYTRGRWYPFPAAALLKYTIVSSQRMDGEITLASDFDQVRKGSRCVIWPVHWQAGKWYMIEMNQKPGTMLDPYLRLLNPYSEAVKDVGSARPIEDDNGGGGFNARIIHGAIEKDRDGFIVTTTAGPNQFGAFELVVSEINLLNPGIVTPVTMSMPRGGPIQTGFPRNMNMAPLDQLNGFRGPLQPGALNPNQLLTIAPAPVVKGGPVKGQPLIRAVKPTPPAPAPKTKTPTR